MRNASIPGTHHRARACRWRSRQAQSCRAEGRWASFLLPCSRWRYSRPMSTGMASCSGGTVQGQVVLVLQGGGALGAYQVGVYQALHEAGLEPDWGIGTSIGAINAALIAGNRQDGRLARLAAFWDKVRL